ncbi:MAG: HAD family phosphatase [Clostridiales bacterium]|nr:HAD family phosphatase [Clostridiales bacterium]
MFKNKKVIVFDMDGTLIDSVGIWNEIDLKLINKLGNKERITGSDVQKQRDEILTKYSKIENPYTEYFNLLGKRYCSNLNGEEILKLRYEIAQNYLESVIDYKPNAEKLIKKLKEKGYILGIASTTRKNNMNIYRTLNKNIIEKANLDEYFSFIYTREDAKEIKPNPEIYLRILKEQNILKSECLIFEDSLIGVEAAKNAGIDCIAVYDKYSDADREKINELSDYQIEDYLQVIEELKRK